MRISFFDNLDISSENIRYLLWSTAGLDRKQWVAQLAGWLSTNDLDHVTALLGGLELITPYERQKLLTAFDWRYTEQTLQYERLLMIEGVDILLQNIHFLIESLGDVKQKDFALGIGVGPVTVSRWRRGEQKPQRPKQAAIISYLGLPHETDLEQDALFLYPLPLTDAQRRRWLISQINQMDIVTMRQMFPALQRLLKNS